jgi:hypothetical protein
METVRTKDGVEIFFKDWGPRNAQPIVFHHGWPLSADDWDTQMMFFLNHGFRVVAHDRRGHGRSTQSSDGHDMDHYADDAAAVFQHLDLRNAIHVGHSTLFGSARGKPGGEGGSDQLSSAADVEDRCESGGPAQVGFRRSAGSTRRQPHELLL